MVLFLVILAGAVILGLSWTSTFPLTPTASPTRVDGWRGITGEVSTFKVPDGWRATCMWTEPGGATTRREIELVVKEIDPGKRMVTFLEVSADLPKDQSPYVLAVEGGEVEVRGVAIGRIVNIDPGKGGTPWFSLYAYRACRK